MVVMPKPRKELISIDATPYYHCVSRCVRRAFLCGADNNGGNFEHRRQWIEDKLLFLSSIFAIDICAFAILSNHTHTVLHIDKDTAINWSTDEVIERWHQLTKGNAISQRYIHAPSAMCNAERDVVYKCAEQWRERLMDISWFMRLLNESIARMANKEDNCTGRFWEGRFKSQALLDEQALMACMAYVDLNPVRAGMAQTPETSDHTSIQKRCQKAQSASEPNNLDQQAPSLLPFAGNPRKEMPKGLPFCLLDYIELVDWTGRCIRNDKRGAIDSNLPCALERLKIEPKHWMYLTQNFESQFKTLVGTAFKIKDAASKLGYQRTPGISKCIQLTV
jgi:REP element-mobilizing transposase RayT